MAILRRPAASGIASGIRDSDDDKQSSELSEIQKNMNLKKVLSTGSIMLDLAISGGTTAEGGIPGGMFIEIFGPSGAGKTALLSELSASCQGKGGEVRFCDPEARLDKEYSRIYGVDVTERFDYHRPDTVSEMFIEQIWPWAPKNPGVINMIAADSIASLSTDLEMDKDEGDKMGMRRAKEFSEGLRKTCRLIAHKQWLIAFSNQIRTGEGGKDVAPGGKAIEFYASLRLRVKPSFPSWQIKKKVKLSSGVEVEEVIGIKSTVYIAKSSVDKPYREAEISVVFGYGIDDVRDQLQWYKDMTKETSYNCLNGKTAAAMERAIAYIEENELQRELKIRTIAMWREIQEKFKTVRQSKAR
jgi:protein RecA